MNLLVVLYLGKARLKEEISQKATRHYTESNT